MGRPINKNGQDNSLQPATAHAVAATTEYIAPGNDGMLVEAQGAGNLIYEPMSGDSLITIAVTDKYVAIPRVRRIAATNAVAVVCYY